MKKLAVLSILLYSSLFLSAQSSAKYSYLVVRIPTVYNRGLDTIYCIIRAENGNSNAHEIYALIPFNSTPEVLGTMENFYSRRTDTSKQFFNFFENTTEALQFLSERGWELFSIANNVTSSTDTQQSGGLSLPYTTIVSSPVYYFRKTIK